ncbi:hypothetical protein HMPREF9440_01866 [Sutterella parvirubra YIT 11816]|uniref:Uncharacterized protein n=1 Tax=Sutterella parvirubra YIT 11816 TaxID=762967 RepID=H3KGI6_9BURK|nr:hypothetical protein HMPREF9440_01866 [Sutterella parvirubra YIT 11816]
MLEWEAALCRFPENESAPESAQKVNFTESHRWAQALEPNFQAPCGARRGSPAPHPKKPPHRHVLTVCGASAYVPEGGTDVQET